jgi:hypothetical protein
VTHTSGWFGKPTSSGRSSRPLRRVDPTGGDAHQPGALEGGRAADAAALQTLKILKYPNRHYRRVVEDVKPLGLVVRRLVSVEIDPPPTTSAGLISSTLVVPLLSPPRGQLLSNLSVATITGERLRTLTHVEHLDHAGRMVELTISHDRFTRMS